MKPDALKGHLDALILAVLSSGPRHGYAIIEELRARSGGALALPEGTVYPALHRLEEAGFLASSWSSGARRRRVYRLTSRGERELGVRRTEWRQFVRTVEAVLTSASLRRSPPGSPTSWAPRAPAVRRWSASARSP